MTCPSCQGVLVRREVEPVAGAADECTTTFAWPAEHQDHQVVSINIDVRTKRSVWWICTSCRREHTAAQLVAVWRTAPIVAGTALQLDGLLEVACGKCGCHFYAPDVMRPLLEHGWEKYVTPAAETAEVPAPWLDFVVDGRWVMCPACYRASGTKYAIELVPPPPYPQGVSVFLVAALALASYMP